MSNAKKYYRMDNIGHAKYTVNKCDGVQKYRDGSDFFDIAIFKSKKALSTYIEELTLQGYSEIERWNISHDIY